MEKVSPDTTMTDSEAESFVISLLEDLGPLSTMEIEMHAQEHQKRCPDQTVNYLVKLMHRGIIQGEVSVEKRGWVWRIPQVQTPPG